MMPVKAPLSRKPSSNLLTPRKQVISNSLYMPTLEDFLSHPIETLEKALHIRKQIDQFQNELQALFGAHPPAIAAIQVFETKRRGRPKAVSYTHLTLPTIYSV